MEWFPSKYNSDVKPYSVQSHKVWPGLQLRKNVVGKTLLPFGLDGMGTRKRFCDYFELLIKMKETAKKKESGDHDNKKEDVGDGRNMVKHPATIALENWEAVFGLGSVKVIDMHHLPPVKGLSSSIGNNSKNSNVLPKNDDNNSHKVDPFLHYFFCDILRSYGRKPSLSSSSLSSSLSMKSNSHDGNQSFHSHSLHETCLAVGNGRLGQNVAQNPSINLGYDLLAVGAYERGWVPTKYTKDVRSRGREKIASLMKKHWEGEGVNNGGRPWTDLPLTCLPHDEINRLFNVSLEMEVDFFLQFGDRVNNGRTNNDDNNNSYNNSYDNDDDDDLSRKAEKVIINQEKRVTVVSNVLNDHFDRVVRESARVGHEASFSNMELKKAFCSIDANRTLNDDPRWVSFMNGL